MRERGCASPRRGRMLHYYDSEAEWERKRLSATKKHRLRVDHARVAADTDTGACRSGAAALPMSDVVFPGGYEADPLRVAFFVRLQT